MNRKFNLLYKFYKNIQFRPLSTSGKETYLIEKLKDRSLVLVTGKDAVSLLQRLMTNDIKQLETGSNGMYTMFLNNKGMIIHDAIVYYCDEQFLIEIDNKAVQPLLIHMKMYKGAREVDIKSVEEKFSVWTVFSDTGKDKGEELEDVTIGDGWLTCMDPRLWELGLRVVGPKGQDAVAILRQAGVNVTPAKGKQHLKLRYSLGVAEGVKEIPYGRCHPLEANADYLNAINQKKTHFIGWETNVNQFQISKRVLPLSFPKNLEDHFSVFTPIEDLKGRKKTPIGYLCGIKGDSGIGLICVSEALHEAQVRIGKVLARCSKPLWWPNRSTLSTQAQ